MEPITSTILAALAAGATAAVKDTAGTAIKDAYQGLTALIRQRFAGKSHADVVLTEHEKDPDTWKKPMEKALIESEVDQDEEIVLRARELLKLLTDAKQPGLQVYGSGAAADHGGVAAGQGGVAAGGNVSIGSWGKQDE